ncbi:hypothetical protein NECHADRAFT_54865 [Paecilomyces variotii No. 5]|uniref:Uncharacterized protein n=1 Tax=Byssochlamys spectabilis (strain No. 5 / NBRC 109023) TaxID=1356009 RepID=V5FZ54_BYSSN|nr:hypothetical protein NECHADRAFT_54865 [Paecilomyces variotii No. 5]
MPPSRRTWGYVAFLGFWGIINLTVVSWTTGSSLLSTGLSVWETMVVLVIGQALVTCLALANGWTGAEWHIGFTVAQRMTLGIYGSYIGILIRIILSIVCWSYSFLTMKNTLSETAHMQTRDLIGFLIFQVISFPLMLIRPEKSKNPVAVSNIIAFCVLVGIAIWGGKEGGTGPLLHQGQKDLSSSERAWAWLYGITSVIGSLCAGIMNQSDYSRFARRPKVQVPGTVFSLFALGVIVPLMGIVTASATMTIYGGDPIWNPVDIIFKWMTEEYNARSRAAAFFSTDFSATVDSLGNGFAGGMDLAGLFPKFINIRRGCVITALLSWVVQPWLMYNTSSTFVAAMSSFSVFLAPLTGIMICDYFFLRKRRIQLSALYTRHQKRAFWYNCGVNWRGILTWVVCFAPALPGMIAELNGTVRVTKGAVHYYYANYIFGWCEAAFLYYVLSKIFPPDGVGSIDEYDIYGTFDRETALRKGMIPFGELGAVDGNEDQAQGSETTVEVTDTDGYSKGAQADEHMILGSI